MCSSDLVSGRIAIDSVVAAIREKFPARIAEGNIAAARAAHDHVLREMQEATHAHAD